MKLNTRISYSQNVLLFLWLWTVASCGISAGQPITVAVALEGRDVRVCWNSQSNQLFALQWTLSLNAPVGWLNLTNLSATQSGNLCLSIPATNSSCFIRVVDVSAPDLDPDGDGLNNLTEATFGTDRLSSDTDSDGLPDGWEVRFGFDPTSGQGNNGALGDPDCDGISNIEEFRFGFNPSVGTQGNPAELNLRVFRPSP